MDSSRSLTFGYDPVDRLSRVTMAATAPGPLRREDYVFDTNGNRVSVERRANASYIRSKETQLAMRTTAVTNACS